MCCANACPLFVVSILNNVRLYGPSEVCVDPPSVMLLEFGIPSCYFVCGCSRSVGFLCVVFRGMATCTSLRDSVVTQSLTSIYLLFSSTAFSLLSQNSVYTNTKLFLVRVK